MRGCCWIPGPLGGLLDRVFVMGTWVERLCTQESVVDGPGPVLSADRAVVVARSSLQIPLDWGEPEVSLDPVEAGLRWAVTWRMDQNSHRVEVDPTSGLVTGLFREMVASAEGELFRLTPDEATVKAEEGLRVLLPEALRKEIALAADLWLVGGHSYALHFPRLLQGCPVSGEGALLVIDGEAGELLLYALHWEVDGRFEPAEALLPRPEAEQRFRLALTPDLIYEHIESANAYRLLYPFVSDVVPLIDQAGDPLRLPGRRRLAVELPVPDLPFVPPGQPLDEAEALAVAQRVTGRSKPPTSAEWNALVTGARRIAFTWEGEGIQSATIDVESGLTQLLYGYDLPPGEGAKLGAGDLLAVASQFLASYRPDLGGRCRLVTFPGDSPERGYFVLYPIHRGIPVDRYAGSIKVDRYTGQVVEFAVQPDILAQHLPEPFGLIGAEEARDQFLTQVGLGLVWYGPWQEAEGRFAERRLYWAPRAWSLPRGIDAQTGRVVGASMLPTVNPRANRAMSLLALSAIMQPEEAESDPDQPVTKGQALRWLVEVTRKRLRRFTPSGSDLLGMAVANGILDGGTDLAAPVTRAEFAAWAVRAIGYGPVAAMLVAIPLALVDADQVDPLYANAVALLVGLGIAEPDAAGGFQPAAPLTFGEAANIVYRAGLHLT